MFTGIISDIGEITAIEQKGDIKFTIKTRYDTDKILLGASIACSGVCLTVVEMEKRGADSFFSVEASAETVSVTTAKNWAVGTKLNLERALQLGDELGGHIVTGHVDGLADIMAITPDGESKRFSFAAPQALKAFIAPKGSVTLDGTSLTVNAVEDNVFTVNIIPHTQAVTLWGQAEPGQMVNVEIDILARYVARLRACEGGL